MTSRSTKQTRLDAIAKSLLTSNCPLRKTATQPVPGEGNPNADILFIGEAPGRNEDETGKPFIGQAGKILDEFLASVKLKREDVFITSIEKFRPPKNRVPKPKEIMACFPVLEQQITIIEPKVIVTLGRHALQRMLEWESGEEMSAPSMSDYHGKSILSAKGYIYFPLYHPAAVLYNRKLLQTMKEDFLQVISAISA